MEMEFSIAIEIQALYDYALGNYLNKESIFGTSRRP